jgi:ferredoxin-nitrite reductase
MVEGYHLHVGGGYGEDRAIARELYRDVPATEVPHVVERLLRTYLDHRAGYTESFIEFVGRPEIVQHKELLERHAIAA